MDGLNLAKKGNHAVPVAVVVVLMPVPVDTVSGVAVPIVVLSIPVVVATVPVVAVVCKLFETSIIQNQNRSKPLRGRS